MGSKATKSSPQSVADFENFESGEKVLVRDEEVEAQRQQTLEALPVTVMTKTASSEPIWGICALSDSEIFATQGLVVLLWVIGEEATIYAGGKPFKGNSPVGHRLKEARFPSYLKGIFASRATGIIWLTCNNRVVKIEDDLVSRFAGSDGKGHRDGRGEEALLNDPTQIVEHRGELFVAEPWNHCIRRIDMAGNVTTIGTLAQNNKDGPLKSCSFYYPRGVCVGPGNSILVSLTGRKLIKKIDLDENTLSTIAGGDTPSRDQSVDGDALNVSGFSFPRHLCYSPTTDEIFVSDNQLRRIRASWVYTFKDVVVEHNNSTASISLTDNGTLCWSTIDGQLAAMPNTVPPRRSLLKHSLGALCLSTQFSDLEFFHQPSSTHIPLHTIVLRVWNIDPNHFCTSLKESCSVENIENFIFSLYHLEFAPSNVVGLERAYRIANFVFIGHLLNMSQPLLTWCIWSLQTLCIQLNPSDLLSFIRLAKKELWTDELIRRTIKGFSSESNPTLASNLDAASRLGQDLELVKLASEVVEESLVVVVEPKLLDQETYNRRYRQNLVLHVLPTLFEMSLGVVPEDDAIDSNPSLPQTVELSADQASTHVCSPNFEFRIPSFDVDLDASNPHSLVRIRCHRELLYPNWPWFQSLVQSGLAEVESGVVSLPSDFPPSLLVALLRYLYCPLIVPETLSGESLEYLWAHAGLYRLVDVDGNTFPQFQYFLDFCRHLDSRTRRNNKDPRM